MSNLLLIIDDNRVCSDVLAAYFRHRGFRTALARDGLEGLAAARRERPGLILLDIAMPHMDGVQFLEALRADEALAPTPVIVTTAVTDEKIGRRTAELGVVGYTVKGLCSLQELYQIVSKQLGVAPSPPVAVRAAG